MRKVYLIFAPNDEPFVLQLAQELKTWGFEVDGSRANDTWDSRLAQLIRSDFAIYIVSTTSIGSEDWRNLIDEAVRRRIPIQGVLINNTAAVFPEPGFYPMIDMTGGITEPARINLKRSFGHHASSRLRSRGCFSLRQILPLFAILLIGIGLFAFMFFRNQEINSEATQLPIPDANVAVVQPFVYVRQKDSQWRDVVDTNEIQQGYSIRTDSRGEALIVFADGDQTEMAPNTMLTLDLLVTDQAAGQVRLSLSQGRITNRIVAVDNGLHQVHTPLADAFAQGTIYSVAIAENGTVTFEVVEGEIEILQGEVRSSLKQGETLTIPSTLGLAQASETAAAYTDTPTPTSTPTFTLTPTDMIEPTATPTETTTNTPSPTETPTEEPAVLPSSLTNTASASVSASATPTMRPSTTSASPSHTPRHSTTPTATRTASLTRTPSVTSSPTSTPTVTRTPTHTRTYTPSATFTPTYTPTITLTWTPSVTPIPTNTPFPTRTSTGSPTATIDPNSVPCPGAPVSRLYVGDRARVIVQSGLSLRDEPGFLSVIIAYLAPQEEVLVVDGPVCANDFRWWYVRTEEDVEGWSAEGGIDAYYLEPVN